MKAKRWIAAGAGMAAALALLAGNAQATDDETTDDETTYQYRLENGTNKSAYIRCGSSGTWTTVSSGSSTDLECSGTAVQTKLGDGNAVNWTHDCSTDRPIKRFEYYGYWVGMTYRSGLIVGCRSS